MLIFLILKEIEFRNLKNPYPIGTQTATSAILNFGKPLAICYNVVGRLLSAVNDELRHRPLGGVICRYHRFTTLKFLPLS